MLFRSVGSTYTWYTFTFNYDVAATTKYWIVLEDPYVVGSHYQYWGADNGGSYGDVYYSTDDGSTWTDYSGYTTTFRAYVQPSLSIEYDVSVDYKKKYL